MTDRWRTPCAALVAAVTVASWTAAGADDLFAGYRTAEQLLHRCTEVAASSDRCLLTRYGHSREQRPLVALTLSA
ncbi:MAG: hypothetical protein ACYTJ0_20625, partial [Planctomycetota bacterium]